MLSSAWYFFKTLGSGDNTTNTTTTTPSTLSTLSKQDGSQETKPGSQWRYSDDEDSMGRKRSFASVTSTNTLSFDFPYQGSQHGTLTVRKSAHWGTNVVLHVEKGQFLCGIDECILDVRFDSGPIRQVSAGGPADHSTTVLFLHNESTLISQMRKAKIVRIEATFYQEGSKTLEFNVEGLKWK